MLDKDIDRLFQERFEALEMAPENLVWDKISKKLDESQSKKQMNPAIWKAAASILVFLSAALWFYRPQEVIKLHGKSDANLARIESTEPIILTAESVSKVDQIAEITVRKYRSKKRSPNEHTHSKHAEVFLSSQKVESATKGSTNYRPGSNEVIEPVQIETIYASVPENTNQVVMTTKLDFAESQLLESESPKIKIRSIGSLVNFVIAKVDHREDKIIEFKDNDEGSEVSGINLGVLKFKSRNKH